MLPTQPSLPPATAVTWTPTERALSAAVTDGRVTTYELLRVGSAQDPCDFGLKWPEAVTVGTITVSFASLGGRSFEPDPRATHVELWQSRRWEAVPADLEIDTRRVGEIAPAQGRGTVRWTFRFRPQTMTRVRVYASAPAHRDLAYQCIALTEVSARPEGVENPSGAVTRIGPSLEPPACLEPGADLAVPEAGATVSPGKPWQVTWLRPILVTGLRAPRGVRVVRVEWTNGDGWRSVEGAEAAAYGKVSFAPHCVTGLRVHTDRPAARIAVTCGPEAADYYEAVRLCRTDMLGERFRAQGRRDLSAMDSLMHPIDFAKTAIGRPADLVETMVSWTGTFFQMHSAPCRDPNTGAGLPAQALDRWYAPLPFGKAPDWFRTRSAYLDGWMPAVVTTYEHGGLRTSQTVFVTAPGAAAYGAVALVTITNPTRTAKRASFAMAMGLRRIYGEPTTPFISDPLETGYRLAADRRTVRDREGNIALHAFQPGNRAGTPRELHMRNTVTLEPGQSATLAFFVPDTTAPLRDAAGLAALDPQRLLEEFRSYWRRTVGSAARLELPEARLADAARNLLAQCMIIGLDGDVARYGAYHYESYFGLEEGWAAVALAQFGIADYARRIMDYMLSDECLDKRNYHHQYRNGLAPRYAADVARLCPDDAWLRRIAPTLRRCADWTIAQIEANKDPKWGGILPRHAYGGDIGMPAYSFYSNATCWRGLHDTAVMLARLGDADAAKRYADAAAKYRRRLVELADSLADSSGGIPFLPMSFGLIENGKEREKEPPYAALASDVPYSDLWTYLGNYWNLFAPCFQELRMFPVGDQRAEWVPHYMEQRGGILAGQVRFANGLDAVYGKGYIQALLDSGRREEFLTSLFGLFSAAMSRDLHSNPEVSGVFPLRTGNLPIWREHARERWFWSYRYGGSWAQGWQNQEGEPLAAGAGMALQLLRSALVREDYSQDPPTTLRVLDGAPAHWFEPGKRIVLRDLRTFFGTVSLEVASEKTGARAVVDLGDGFAAERLVFRIPSPDGRPIRSATVNGKPATIKGNEISVAGPSGLLALKVVW